MKQLLYFFVSVVTVLLTSCSSYDIPDMVEQPTSSASEEEHHVSLDDAQFLASNVLGQMNPSRSGRTIAEVDYVLSSPKSRAERRDTIAYIINYANDEGFAIIAADNRVNPVLAISDNNNFSRDNEIVMTEFVDKLEDYIAYKTAASGGIVIDPDPLIYCKKEPRADLQLSQGYPYDKYVKLDHPGYPVGCVAIATVQVMLYSKPYFKYHDEYYFTNKIMAPYVGWYDNNDNNNSQADPNGASINPGDIVIEPTDPYIGSYDINRAIERIAKLVWLIGVDVDMQFEEDSYGNPVAGAFPTDAVALLKDVGFIELYNGRFNQKLALDYLMDSQVMYMEGYNKDSGHSWICDGCMYSRRLSSPDSEYVDTWVYCVWGWGKTGNGYYSGEVFEFDSTKSDGYYRPHNIYVFKNEKQ